MRINLSSVLVDDQEKALKFYTEKLGFVLKTDVPVGEYRWLTVTSPDGPEGVELVLEPMGFSPAATSSKRCMRLEYPSQRSSAQISKRNTSSSGAGVVFQRAAAPGSHHLGVV
jgi:catechol 2,3-dioxygenase-like lactoylglutathione lyase family enzyme